MYLSPFQQFSKLSTYEQSCFVCIFILPTIPRNTCIPQINLKQFIQFWKEWLWFLVFALCLNSLSNSMKIIFALNLFCSWSLYDPLSLVAISRVESLLFLRYKTSMILHICSRSCSVCLSGPDISFSRFFYVVTYYIISSFLLVYSNALCTCHIFFNRSSIDVHLVWFHIWAIMNNAAINFEGLVSLTRDWGE